MMNMKKERKKFIVRNLKWEDMHALVSNYYSYFEESRRTPYFGLLTYGKKPSFSEEVKWFGNLYSDMLSKKAVVSVAEIDGKVVGMCDAHKKSELAEASHIAIMGIAIKDGYRSIGIGTALLKDCIKKSRGVFDELLVDIFETNKRSYALCKSAGFKDMGTNPAGSKRYGKYLGERRLYLILKRRKKL